MSGDLTRGGDDVVDDILGRPLPRVSCDCRLAERACIANCSGIAGLGGRSTSVADPDDMEPRPVAMSNTLGLRFRAASGGCSVLDRGVDELDLVLL